MRLNYAVELRYGILLFFLGLVTGLVVPMLANPRMGLSSHLEGLMNGMFLIILGLTALVFRYVGRMVYYESGG